MKTTKTKTIKPDELPKTTKHHDNKQTQQSKQIKKIKVVRAKPDSPTPMEIETAPKATNDKRKDKTEAQPAKTSDKGPDMSAYVHKDLISAILSKITYHY